MSLAVDEERRGEVLEPRPGRRRGVAGEVRAEVTVADQPQRSGRPRDVRPFGLPRLHGGVPISEDGVCARRRTARTCPPANRATRTARSRRARPRGGPGRGRTGGGARRRRRAAPPSPREATRRSCRTACAGVVGARTCAPLER